MKKLITWGSAYEIFALYSRQDISRTSHYKKSFQYEQKNKDCAYFCIL